MGADGQPVPGAKVRVSSDHMAEARILESLRKAQADEAKILGLVTPEDEKGPRVIDNRSIIIVNDAGITSNDPWLASIEPGQAKQGIGLLPLYVPGQGTNAPEMGTVEAEVVQPEVNAGVDSRK
jgi:hypothetical protein